MRTAGARRRGFTLVEGMITVALIAIVSLVAGTTAVAERKAAAAVLDAERAAQVLEYEADCLSSGKPVDPEVLARLLADLPKARVEIEKAGRAATATVWWTRGRRTASRSLTVFAKGAR